MYLSTRLVTETLVSVNRMWSAYHELCGVIDGLYLYLLSGGDEANQYDSYGEKERKEHIERCADSVKLEIEKLAQLYPDKDLQEEFTQVHAQLQEIYRLISEFELKNIVLAKGTLQSRMAEMHIWSLVTALSEHIQSITPLSGKQAELVTIALVEQSSQAAIQQMFVLFEEALRKRIGVGAETYGRELINKAFGSRGVLTWGETPAERNGVRNLLDGAYATFRNPHMHRLIENDSQTVLSVITLVDLLIKIVDEAQFSGS